MFDEGVGSENILDAVEIDNEKIHFVEVMFAKSMDEAVGYRGLLQEQHIPALVGLEVQRQPQLVGVERREDR